MSFDLGSPSLSILEKSDFRIQEPLKVTPPPPPLYIPTGVAETVDSSANDFPYSVPGMMSRPVFYANGLYWVFFARGFPTTNLAYKTSSDGIAWSSVTTVTGMQNTLYNYSIWFDGTHVYYAVCNSSQTLLFRMGTPQSNGTISWLAVEQTVESNVYTPCITVSGGYPWIAFVNASGLQEVVTSSTNNGTWTTAATFPHIFSGSSDEGGEIYPMTNGKVLVAYWNTAQTGIILEAWTGSAFLPAVTISNVSSGGWGVLAGVNIGDVVHIYFVNTLTYPNYYVEEITYTYSTNTATTAAVPNTPVGVNPGCTYDPVAKYIYLFWPNSSGGGTEIDYAIETSPGVWTSVKKVVSDTDIFPTANSYYNPINSQIAMIYDLYTTTYTYKLTLMVQA